MKHGHINTIPHKLLLAVSSLSPQFLKSHTLRRGSGKSRYVVGKIRFQTLWQAGMKCLTAHNVDSVSQC